MSETPNAEIAPETPSPKRMWRRRILIGLVVVFLGMQLVPVDRSNPPVMADLTAPDDVKAILKRACYDCHSNETHWPWYSYVAPGSWLMARDVHEGRESLNFSHWGEDYGDEDAGEMFGDVGWESIESGEMPLWFYLPLHPEAKLTEQDLKTLKVWIGLESADEEVAGDSSAEETIPDAAKDVANVAGEES